MSGACTEAELPLPYLPLVEAVGNSSPATTSIASPLGWERCGESSHMPVFDAYVRNLLPPMRRDILPASHLHHPLALRPQMLIR